MNDTTSKEWTITLAGAVEASVFAVAHGDERWKSAVIQMIHQTISTTTASTRRNNKWYDIEIRIAPALFRRFGKRTWNESSDEKTSYNGSIVAPLAPLHWTIKSEHGVERDVSSPAHLAGWLLPELEHECITRNIGRHVRIAPKSNFICITSYTMEQSLEQDGFLPCPECPWWCPSKKGLWWHLQHQHGTSHHAAVEAATYHDTRHSTAIVIYCRPLQDDEHRRATPACQQQDSPNFSTSDNDVLVPSCDTPWDAVKRGSLGDLKRLLPCPQLLNSNNAKRLLFDARKDRDHHGSLLLHWAAGGGHVPLVQYLVETMGCDANAPQMGHRSFAGRTPLHWAARNGHVAVVDYLLSVQYSHNRSIDATTDDGTTAFCWAAWQGHLSIMERLWQAGCNIQSTNRFGCNAALWAAQGNNATPDTLQWLSDRGCSILVTNQSRHGVLHKAAQRGQWDVCQWFVRHQLLDKACDDWISRHHAFPWELIGPDAEHATPSDLAGMEGHAPLAQWLAQMEQSLVVRFVTLTISSSATSHHFVPVPDWLTPYSSLYHAEPFAWAPGEGVLRMRSAYKPEKMSAIDSGIASETSFC
jgi:ankyrin repeat protein